MARTGSALRPACRKHSFQSDYVQYDASDKAEHGKPAHARQSCRVHFADSGYGCTAVYRGDDSQNGNQGVGEKEQFEAYLLFGQ